MTAFRYVHNPIAEEDFLPVALLQPDRPNCNCCEGYSLSLWATKAHALARYTELKKVVKQIEKRIGTHLAHAKLKPEHGTSTPPSNATGHISFFEAHGSEVIKQFKIVEPLDA